MVKNSIGLFLFLFILPLHAQYIDLRICNEIKSKEERDNCLTASLENLITKDLEKNMEMLRLRPGDSVPLKLEVEVNGVGNFAIESIQTPSIAVARAVEAAIYGLKPLEIYRDEAGEIVRTQLSIQTVFTNDENGGLKILSKNKPDTNQADNKILVEEEEVTFFIIEEVPVFPGCQNGSTNQERKDCMAKGITTYVMSNFDLSLVNNIDIKTGIHRIEVQFKVDKEGHIKGVTARAPHPLLEKEAIRVVCSLPKMVPGKHKGQNVNVVYGLPIVFTIEDDAKDKKKQQEKKKRKG